MNIGKEKPAIHIQEDEPAIPVTNWPGKEKPEEVTNWPTKKIDVPVPNNV